MRSATAFIVCFLIQSVVVRADEGMWLLNEPPRKLTDALVSELLSWQP